MPGAIDHAQLALKAAGSDKEKVGQVYRILGMIHNSLGHPEKTSTYFADSITSCNDRPGLRLAQSLLESGKFHTSIGKLEIAEEQLGRTIEMLKEMGADHFLQKAQKAWKELMDLRGKDKELSNKKSVAELATDKKVLSTPVEAEPIQIAKPQTGGIISRLLDQTLDRLLEITRAERGLVLTVPDGKSGIQTLASRHLDDTSVADISQNIVLTAIQNADLVVTTDAPNDPRFETSQSIIDYKIRSVLCMPLRTGDNRILGAIYADHRGLEFFADKDIQFFRAFGDFVAIALDNTLRYRDLQLDLEKLAGMRTNLDGLVGGSPAMQTLYDMVERVSTADIPVLLQGETGTGKGLAARTIHARSKRSSGPFLQQNCAALSKELLESELFGHAKGSFTGAFEAREGLFEAANGGTIFLDEIGDAPPEVQVRLLHVIEEGTVRRVGENHNRNVDVRIIAATNRDLKADVSSGMFREDLYYRLRVVPITIPPLRERPEDIPLLADHLLKLYPPAKEKNISSFDPELIQAFCRHNWPGNIRELENEIRRGVALSEPGATISAPSLSEHFAGELSDKAPISINGPLKNAVAQFEKEAIKAALAANEWNVTHTAEKLGLTRAGLQGKMRKYKIQRDKGKNS